MNLLAEAMVDVVMMERNRVPDGEGGFNDKGWAEGVEFKAAISFDVSMNARIAESQGVKNVYTVTTRKNAPLEYHDVFKRLSDGKIFRVTSDGEDKKTPESAALNMTVVTAEEWELPA